MNLSSAITRKRIRIFTTALFAMLFVIPADAQTARISATLEGTVTDSAGAVIPGAQVTLRDTATNQTRAVQTDERGSFRANELPVGTYEVRVEQSGFAPYLHAGITLAIGQTARLDILLVPAGTAAQITVTDQAPAIDPSQTSVTTTIDTERIEELPVRSRNYLNFVLSAS
jgi:hypothetical protein